MIKICTYKKFLLLNIYLIFITLYKLYKSLIKRRGKKFLFAYLNVSCHQRGTLSVAVLFIAVHNRVIQPCHSTTACQQHPWGQSEWSRGHQRMPLRAGISSSLLPTSHFQPERSFSPCSYSLIFTWMLRLSHCIVCQRCFQISVHHICQQDLIACNYHVKCLAGTYLLMGFIKVWCRKTYILYLLKMWKVCSLKQRIKEYQCEGRLMFLIKATNSGLICAVIPCGVLLNSVLEHV